MFTSTCGDSPTGEVREAALFDEVGRQNSKIRRCLDYLLAALNCGWTFLATRFYRIGGVGLSGFEKLICQPKVGIPRYFLAI